MYMMWLLSFGGSGDGRSARARVLALVDDLDMAGEGKGPIVKRASTAGKRQEQILQAISDLKKELDAGCKAWLETSSSYKDFNAYLESLTSQNLIGWGTITTTNDDSNKIAAVTGSNPSGLAIVVQQNGAFFNSDYWVGSATGIRGNSAKARAFILLHEFAHSAEVSGFEHDSGDVAAGQRNDARVWANCEATLSRFK